MEEVGGCAMPVVMTSAKSQQAPADTVEHVSLSCPCLVPVLSLLGQAFQPGERESGEPVFFFSSSLVSLSPGSRFRVSCQTGQLVGLRHTSLPYPCNESSFSLPSYAPISLSRHSSCVGVGPLQPPPCHCVQLAPPLMEPESFHNLNMAFHG